MESFIDFAIINELSRNVDGYRLSTFLYKDKDSNDSKLYIGPIWDFNLAFGNANYCDGGITTGWAWDFNNICNGDWWLIPFWWKRLLKDPEYVIQFQDRWSELRSGLYSNETLMNYIDSVVFVLDQPQQRNFKQWPILNEWIWPNNNVGGTYENEINYLKGWITSRLSWLDTNIAALEVITELDDMPIAATPITIFPNPNNGQFNVRIETFSNSEISINLYDQLGKIILNKHLNINSLKENTLSVLEP
ncbi:MAG: CotH kinase family protein, partial [Cyclobacteriaceae bacterium]|nr:CotH kinase family protein [Cyclobacteriaceae bacterium]